MRGDFSRIRFSPKKNYTAVLQQQGRVALDADANEQAAINNHLREAETIDVIGPYGGPIDNAGFAITATNNALSIGPGRYYVQGLVCENDTALDYDAQPFLINTAHSESDLLNQLSSGKATSIQVFLEVWERLITALDDPCLREPALGQADTTARRQTVWRVIAEAIPAPVVVNPPPPSILNRPGLLSGINKFVEIDAGIPVLKGVTQASINQTSITETFAGHAEEINPITGIVLQQDCCASMYNPVLKPASGMLSAQTGDGSSDCSCEPTPSAGYRGLENQLYRIEIHQGGNETQATFKWSRENGSIVAAVTGVSGSNVQVDSLGPDANLGFSPNQWIEITDDSNIFGDTPNQPGDLFQIQSTTPEQLTITMTQIVSQVDDTLNPRIRRWDQFGATATANGIPLSPGTWITLENGIQIQFTTGNYNPGDSWFIVARTASGQIEWPPCGSNGATFQPPHGIQVYRAPLACIHWNGTTQQTVVEECRRFFPSLTEIPDTQSNAMHVTAINWSNDDIMTLDQLVLQGLNVTLDQSPTSQVDASSFAVTLEAPVARQQDPASFSAVEIIGTFNANPTTVLRSVTVIDSQITVKGNTIYWNMPYANAPFVQWETLLFLNGLLLLGAPYFEFGRVRVKLKGRTIFTGSGSSQLYLDGYTLGQSAIRADGSTPRTDISLPSGNEERANDFESWFYVAPTLAATALTVATPAMQVLSSRFGGISVVAVGTTTPTITPQATLTVNYPAIAPTSVALTLTGATGVGSIVNVPASVTIAQNQTTVTIPINVTGNPGPNFPATAPMSFTLTATLTSAIGGISSLSATFTLAGSNPSIIGIIGGPVLINQG
jgi:hypothetical protein